MLWWLPSIKLFPLLFHNCYELYCKYLTCRISDMPPLWKSHLTPQRGSSPHVENHCWYSLSLPFVRAAYPSGNPTQTSPVWSVCIYVSSTTNSFKVLIRIFIRNDTYITFVFKILAISITSTHKHSKCPVFHVWPMVSCGFSSNLPD